MPQYLRVSTGDEVTVNAFQPPLEGFSVALLSLELEFVQKRRSPAPMEIDAKSLAKHILARYTGQVLSIEALFWEAIILQLRVPK